MKSIVLVLLLTPTLGLAEDFSVLKSAREVAKVRQYGGTTPRGETATQRAILENLEIEARKEPRYDSSTARDWAVRRFERKVKEACEASIGVKTCQ